MQGDTHHAKKPTPGRKIPSPAHHILPVGICLFRTLLHRLRAEALPHPCLWLNMPHCVHHLHALPTHGHLELLFSQYSEKPLFYYLSNGMTVRYLHHKHSLHPPDPTLSGLIPKAPPKSHPPQAPPSLSIVIPPIPHNHSSPSSVLDFPQPYYNAMASKGAVVTLRKWRERI